MPYVSPAVFLSYYDNRIIGDLCSDVGQRISPVNLLTDPNLAQAISTGAGLINAAVLVANRYTIAELQAMTGDDAAMIQWLNSALAYCRLRRRRAIDIGDFEECKDANNMLQALRNGDRVFDIGANEAAGNPASGFASAVVYAQTNLMRDYARRYFPQRRYQLPINPIPPE